MGQAFFINPVQIEAAFRSLRADAKSQLSAMTPGQARECFEAQDRMFEANMTVVLETVRMLNEERAPNFIGVAVGSFLASILVFAVRNSQDPGLVLSTVNAICSRALTAEQGHHADGLTIQEIDVPLAPIGRA